MLVDYDSLVNELSSVLSKCRLTAHRARVKALRDRKSTRLNSSHSQISYAVFCLKKKKLHLTAVQLHQSIVHSVHTHAIPLPYFVCTIELPPTGRCSDLCSTSTQSQVLTVSVTR